MPYHSPLRAHIWLGGYVTGFLLSWLAGCLPGLPPACPAAHYSDGLLEELNEVLNKLEVAFGKEACALCLQFHLTAAG